MKRRITHADLVVMKGLATDFYLQLPAGARLPGMARALTPAEIQSLAWIDAALTVLGNSDVEIVTEYPDSDSIHED